MSEDQDIGTTADKLCSFSIDLAVWNDAHDTDVEIEERFLDDGVWHCYRRVRPNDGYCIFHSHETEKEISDERPTAGVLFDIVNGTTAGHSWGTGEHENLWQVPEMFDRDEYGHRQKQFIGASFGAVQLSYERLSADDSYPIDVRCARVGSVDLTNAQVDHELRLDGIQQTGDTNGVILDGARITGDLSIDGASLSGDFSLNELNVQGAVSFDDLYADGSVSARNAMVSGEVRGTDARVFSHVVFDGASTGRDMALSGTQIDGHLSAVDMSVDGVLDAQSVSVGGFISFDNVTAGVSLLLDDAQVTGKWTSIKTGVTAESGEVSLEGIDIGNRLSARELTLAESLSIRDVIIRDNIDLYNMTGGSDVSLVNAELQGGVLFEQAAVDGEAEIQNSTIEYNIILNNVVLTDGLKITQTAVNGAIGLKEAEICGPVELTNLTIKLGIDAEEAQIDGAIHINRATSDNKLQFTKCIVEGPIQVKATTALGLSIRGTEVVQEVDIVMLELERHIDLFKSFIGGTVSIADSEMYDIKGEKLQCSGGLSILRSTLNSSVNVSDAKMGDPLEIETSTINYSVIAEGMEGTNVVIRQSAVDVGITSKQIRLLGSFIIQGSEVDIIRLTNGQIAGSVELARVDLGQELRLDGITVQENVVINSVEVGRFLSIDDARIDYDIDISRSGITDEFTVDRTVVDGSFIIEDTAVGDSIRLGKKTTIGGRTAIERTIVSHLTIQCELTHPGIRAVSLAGTTVEEGTLYAGVNELDEAGIVYDFERATLGDVDIAADALLPFEHARFLETGFDGFIFNRQRERFRGIDWQVHKPRNGGYHDIAVATQRIELGDSEAIDSERVGPETTNDESLPTASEAETLKLEDEDESEHKKEKLGDDSEGIARRDRDGKSIFDAARDTAETVVACLLIEAEADVEPEYYRPLGTTIDQFGDSVSSVDRLKRYRSDSYDILDITTERPQGDPVSRVHDWWSTVVGRGKERERPFDKRVPPVEECVETLRKLLADDEDARRALVERDSAESDSGLTNRLDAAFDRDEDPPGLDVIKKLEAAIAREVADPEAVQGTDRQLESTYAEAKNGASEAGDDTAAGHFFQREASYARRQHWNRCRGRTDANEDRSRLRSILDWFGNIFLWGTMGYGERPLRALGFAGAIIMMFAVFYWTVEEFIGISVAAGSTIVDHIALSLGLFVTLVITGPTIENDWMRLIAQFEGFLGVFIAGMFVVAVTRAIHR